MTTSTSTKKTPPRKRPAPASSPAAEAQPEVVFEKRVWNTLSKIDVSAHTEKKGGLTYLSWAWAWGIIMQHFPQTTFKFRAPSILPDGTAEVWVTVTVREGDHRWRQRMWLPVLDFKNQPIQHPNAFHLNTTRMRVLTKALAMFGLGHYIYAGEDTPAAALEGGQLADHSEQVSPETVLKIQALISQTNTDVERFLKAFNGISSVADLPVASAEQAVGLLTKKLQRQQA